jgi:hypothetical protein
VCGVLRETSLTHVITGEEKFLHRTLASVGVPPLHIIRAHNGSEYRFYELTGDEDDALHFHDFEPKVKMEEKKAARIRLSDTPLHTTDSTLSVKTTKPSQVLRIRQGRIRLRD